MGGTHGPLNGLWTYKFSGGGAGGWDARAPRWPLDLQIPRQGVQVAWTHGPPDGLWPYEFRGIEARWVGRTGPPMASEL